MKCPVRLTAILTLLLTIILSCTKEVIFKTEVEFDVTVEHNAKGYIDEDLSTVITVVPEEVLEEFFYSYSYSVSKGEGHFTDRSGAVLPQIESIALNPFSASIKYVGTKSGHHRVKVIATDNYGFTEEVDIDYTVEAITAVEEIIPVEKLKSDKNEITAFALDGQMVDSNIDDTEHTISIDVPYGTALNVAPSVLTVSSLAEVYPSDLGQKDFNSTVIYSVKAENGDIREWTVNVTVAPKPNEAPMVDAGDDFTVTLPKDSLTLNLTLNGAANDNDGLVTTEWIMESGVLATIADPGSLNTEVTGLTAGTYVFRLTATDDDGATDTDTVTVRINNPPTADAGDSIFLSQPRNSVKVYGLASDIDGTFTVKWTQVEGKAATIVNPDSLDIEITGLLEGLNVFELTATDNDNAIAKDRMFVEVKPPAVP